MKIAHFGPFAPGRCGLYETMRDIIVAERLLGHTADLVDIGVEGKRHVGGRDYRDDRPESGIRTVDYPDVEDYDLFVVHSNIPKSFLAKTNAPVVQIIHGRPESSFRLEQKDPKHTPVYSIHREHGSNPRWVKFITLWEQHLPYWKFVIPADKLVATTAPPCDLHRFPVDGPRHEFAQPGDTNILIGDLWRPDMDSYQILHLAVGVLHRWRGPRIHVYGCQVPLGPWRHLFDHLRSRGLLGDVKGVMKDFDRVLRAADVVLTGHTIATRIVREATAVGTRVYGPHLLGGPFPQDASIYSLERIGPELILEYEQVLDEVRV